jgi:hypothetical protein
VCFLDDQCTINYLKIQQTQWLLMVICMGMSQVVVVVMMIIQLKVQAIWQREADKLSAFKKSECAGIKNIPNYQQQDLITHMHI